MVSYWLVVAVDATLNTGKKTCKMVDLIFSEALTTGGMMAVVACRRNDVPPMLQKALEQKLRRIFLIRMPHEFECIGGKNRFGRR